MLKKLFASVASVAHSIRKAIIDDMPPELQDLDAELDVMEHCWQPLSASEGVRFK